MRMSTELYKDIKSSMDKFVEMFPQETSEHVELIYMTGEYKNFRKRVIFDIFHAVNEWNQIHTQKYIKDHILEEGLIDCHLYDALIRMSKNNKFIDELISKYEILLKKESV